MGEAADAILEGDCCEICGCFFEECAEDNYESPGHPRTCNGCGGDGGQTL